MREPSKPRNEAERLDSLKSYGILDTLPEASYDDIVGLAAAICEVPIALVSLVDDERQWFKARFGIDATETPRDVSFCGHVVETGRRLIVADATLDDRFSDNPLVTNAPNVRFYAGEPLRDSAGFDLGTLCVIDHQPRVLSDEKIEQLSRLGRLVVALIQKRRDTQVRHDAETALVHARNQQQRFFDLSLDMMCVAGFDGFFKQLNPAWTEVLGLTQEELLGRPFIEFVHPDDRDATIQEATVLAQRTRQTVNFENRYRAQSGDYRWLRWTATFDPDHETILAAARDVTSERTSAAQLREALAAAETANRAKSLFLASMSHELRTPLNSVIGFTNLLAKNKRGGLGADELLYLGRISANGRHLLSLINDVLDISRIEGAKLDLEIEPIDVRALAAEVIDELHGTASERGNHIRLDAGEVGIVRGDRKRLKQVLINLVGNANKFTDDGAIVVRIESHDGCPVRLDVIDSGLGIAPSDQVTIFDAFKQAKEGHNRPYGGTGLGLSISRALCDCMGFGLGVVSELGKGSTFYIAFDPTAVAPAHIAPVRREQRSERQLHTPAVTASFGTVLIIDDDSDARMLLTKLIEETGANVVSADSASRGLSIARALKPSVIVLDLCMPSVTGQAALREINKDPTLRTIPVIVCSSLVNPEGVAGSVLVLEKPIDRQAFLSALRENLGAASDVLIVEDDADSRLLLETLVAEIGAQCRSASNGVAALAEIERSLPSLIILDLCMPEMNGFEFLTLFRKRPETERTRVIVCTAMDVTAEQGEFLRVSTDAVVKKSGSSVNELAMRMRQHLGMGGTP